MADFNSGSIEAQLKLNRDPFIEGLREARRQGEDFESRDFTATARLNAEEARTALDELNARADEMDGRDIELRVGVRGGAEARAELDAIRNSADGGGSGGNGGGGLLGALGALGAALGPALMGGGALTALGALPGVLAAGAGAAGGLAGALSVVAGNLIPFGLVAKADFTSMQNSLKLLTKGQTDLNKATTDPQKIAALKEIATATAALKGPAGTAATAFQHMNTVFAELRKNTGPAVFGTMTAGFGLVSQLLPKLAPLVNATGGALTGAIHQLSIAFASPQFQKFLTFLATEIGPVISQLTGAFITFSGGFASLLENAKPMIDAFLRAIGDLAATFNGFASGPGFKQFVAFAVDIMPVVAKTLGMVGKALFDVLLALVPAIAPALSIIQQLAGWISQLAPILGPLIAAFLQLLSDALVPLLPILTQIVAAIGPTLISTLQLLAPLLPVIADAFLKILEAIAPLLPQLAGLIADALPPLLDLVVAIVPFLPPLVRGMIDFTRAIVPLIPVITAFVRFLTPLIPLLEPLVVGFLAWSASLYILDAALFLIESPILLIVAAVALLAFGIYELVKHWQQVVDFLHGKWGTAISVALAVIMPFVGLPLLIIGHWKQISGFFIGLWNTVSGAVKSGINTAIGIIKGVPKIFNDVKGAIASAWNGLWSGMSGAVSSAFHGVTNVIIDIVNGIITVIDGAISGINDVISGANYLPGVNIHHIPGIGHIDKPTPAGPSSTYNSQVPSFRALGGPVMAGLSYWVGENGPEKFTAATNGKITNNRDSTSAWASTARTGNTDMNGQAQLNAINRVVMQLAHLISVTKQNPAQTGEHVTEKLRPVLTQQTERAHQYAKQRTVQGVGYGG